MEHSSKYYEFKRFYDDGLWSIQRLVNAVKKNAITIQEFEEITSKDYSKLVG